MSDNEKCKLCGEVLESGVKYCGCCGAEIITEEAAAKQATSSSEGFSLNFGGGESQSLSMDKFAPEKSEDEKISELLDEKAVDKESEYYSLSTEDLLVSPTTAGMRGPQKALIITLITLGILAIVACCTFVFFPQITMAVMKPQEYYVMQEKSNLKVLANVMSENYKQIFNEMSIEGKMQAELSGGKEFEQLAPLLKALSFDFNYAQNATYDKIAISSGISVDGKSAMNVLIEQINNKVALSFPGLSDGKYVTDYMSPERMIKLMAGDENEIIAMTGVTKEEIQKLCDRYMKEVLVDAFPKESSKKGKGNFEGISATTAEFTIDKVAIGAMAKALADQLEADKDLIIKIINNSIDYTELHSAGMATQGLDFTQADYDKIIAILRSEQMGEGTDIAYKIYYNSRGKIIGRELTTQGVATTLATFEKNGVHSVKVDVKSPAGNFKIDNEYTDKKGIINGTAELLNGATQVASATYSIDNNKKLIGKLAGEANYIITVNNLGSLEIKSQIVSDNELKQEVTVKAAESLSSFALKLMINSKVGNKADLSAAVLPETSLTDAEFQKLTAEATQKAMDLIQPLIEDLAADLGIPMGGGIGSNTNQPSQKVIDFIYNDLEANNNVLSKATTEYDYTVNPEGFTQSELELLRDMVEIYTSNSAE